MLKKEHMERRVLNGQEAMREAEVVMKQNKGVGQGAMKKVEGIKKIVGEVEKVKKGTMKGTAGIAMK